LNLGEGLESYRQNTRKIEIRAIGSLLVAEEEAGTSLAKFRRGAVSGVEKDWPTSIKSSRRVQGWAWDGEELTGGGFPMAAEAAAERSSSARGFPVRRAVKS
jgi:hypothetical protein